MIRFQPKPPYLPTFIMLEAIDEKIPISSLTEEQALDYANFLRECFLVHWKNERRCAD